MNTFKTLLLILIFNYNFASPYVVSHKGAWKDHELPQNTISSLERAIDNGFDGVEFDIQMTLDEVFVLAHDDSLDKVSNCKGLISKKTYLEISHCKIIKNTLLPITKILLHKVKESKTISKLDDVLSMLNSRELKLVWLDLKSQDDKVIFPLVKSIRNYASSELQKIIVVNNGSSKLLTKIKKMFPNIRYSLEGKWGSEPLVDDTFITEAGISHDIISLNVGFRIGDESPLKIIGKKKRFYRRLSNLLNKAHSLSIPVIGWTVNKESKFDRLMTTQLDYLLTDHLYND